MENNMTQLSFEMFNKAHEENFSVENAVAMLRECTMFRTLSQKLNAFSKGRDIKSVLINGLCRNHPEMKPDTVSRNVRNWLNDRQNKIHKADAIELCFILGLNIDESNSLVAMISEEALHWRHPDEIPYIFALLNNYDYGKAAELHKRIKESISPEQAPTDDEIFTDIVRGEIMKIKSEDELVNYVVNNYGKFNSLHNTAYNLFCEMMAILETPADTDDTSDGYLPESEKYSVGRIVQAYMHREDIPEISDKKKKSVFTALQHNVAQNWPSESAISRIVNRHTDVTRKTLILLFLATYDAGDTSAEDEDAYLDWDPDYEKNRDEIFEEFYTNMNNMLEKCGFARLDPRSPFDWIIIFCMCIDDIYEIDGTLSDFLRTLFVNEENGNVLQD